MGAHRAVMAAIPAAEFDAEVLDRLDRVEAKLDKFLGDPRVAALEAWLTKEELAQAVGGVSIRWIESLLPELPNRVIAGRRKFRLSAVEPWLAARGLLEEVER